MLIVADALANRTQAVPDWMSLDAAAMKAAISAKPPASSILMTVNTYLVIEYYAQRS
jgi:hypothetical protein